VGACVGSVVTVTDGDRAGTGEDVGKGILVAETAGGFSSPSPQAASASGSATATATEIHLAK
jgi:hypothetical protein